jgi:hypothetical protein
MRINVRNTILLLALLALPGAARATTTVTGHIADLGGSAVTSNAFVRFQLRGCGGNIPRINGVALIAPTQGAVWYKDFAADASGNITGTLYSNRDAAGTGNGEIECGGSLTATWYGLIPFLAGKAGPEIPVYAKNSGTLDISQVTPITSNPVITSPTGDSTYMRLDAGNSPATGNWRFNGTTNLSNGGNLGGTFTGTPAFSGLHTFNAGLTSAGPNSLSGGGSLSGAFTGNPTLSGNPLFSGVSLFNPNGLTAQNATNIMYAMSLGSSTSLVLAAFGNASAGVNLPFPPIGFTGDVWNGSISVANSWAIQEIESSAGIPTRDYLAILAQSTEQPSDYGVAVQNKLIIVPGNNPPPLSGGNMFRIGGTATGLRDFNLPDASGTPLISGNGDGTHGIANQTKRVSGCATAASLNATCDTTVTWTTAFADASYTATCMGDVVTSGIPIIQGIDISAAKTGAAITVRTISITAAAAQFTTIDCISVHD